MIHQAHQYNTAIIPRPCLPCVSHTVATVARNRPLHNFCISHPSARRTRTVRPAAIVAQQIHSALTAPRTAVCIQLDCSPCGLRCTIQCITSKLSKDPRGGGSPQAIINLTQKLKVSACLYELTASASSLLPSFSNDSPYSTCIAGGSFGLTGVAITGAPVRMCLRYSSTGNHSTGNHVPKHKGRPCWKHANGTEETVTTMHATV